MQDVMRCQKLSKSLKSRCHPVLPQVYSMDAARDSDPALEPLSSQNFNDKARCSNAMSAYARTNISVALHIRLPTERLQNAACNLDS